MCLSWRIGLCIPGLWPIERVCRYSANDPIHVDEKPDTTQFTFTVCCRAHLEFTGVYIFIAPTIFALLLFVTYTLLRLCLLSCARHRLLFNKENVSKTETQQNQVIGGKFHLTTS
ncbi:hypothetical protein AMECASPLE_032824 [Ameca splendens]|uniref:Uncharacterized protein n=1 Tax=Ameca splendens TaxID=208324 RepID=A0ABV1A492_9TELE